MTTRTYVDIGRNVPREIASITCEAIEPIPILNGHDALRTLTGIDFGAASVAVWRITDASGVEIDRITVSARPPDEGERLFAEISGRPTAPSWLELRRLAELGEPPWRISYLLSLHDMDPSGAFEPTAQLRTDDEGDDLGADTDEMLGMGEAESWFREKVNTEETA